MAFYAYRMMLRKCESNFLFSCIFESILREHIDAKIETERLNHINYTSSKYLRAEEYSRLQDAMERDDGNASNAGQLVVPYYRRPSPLALDTSTRIMQDSKTYVRNFGGADLLITFTYKPPWGDIKNAI